MQSEAEVERGPIRGTSRVWVGVVGLFASLAVAAMALVVAVPVWFSTCSGDGGDPFVPRASTAGRFCESDGSSVFLLAHMGLPIAVMVIVAVLAVRTRRWHYLGLGAVASILLIVLMAIVLTSLPTDCDDPDGDNSDACETY